MLASYVPVADDYIRLLPEIIMVVAGTLIMVVEPVLGENKRTAFSSISLVAFFAALAAAIHANSIPGLSFSNMLIIDGFATFFRVLVIGVGILSVLSASQYLRREHADSAEYYALLLFSVTGQCIMAAANELIMIFIGLEISSIATYVLAGYLRDDKRNNEAALKYFLLGSFATAFLLYGIALHLRDHGHHQPDRHPQRMLTPAPGAAVVLASTAAALMFVGFAFKVSAAPFQIWAPDVYQGAPAPVTAVHVGRPESRRLRHVPARVHDCVPPIANRWEPFVWSSALLTMIIGNFAALTQTNIKRLLAYSSIAHAGYVMVAVAAHNQIGIAAAMFYLAAYALMNIGAFAVVTHFSRQGEKYVNIEDLAGLGWKQPVTAGLFAIFLLSLIGVPLTGGFFGKFYIFKAALDANLVWLAVLGLLNSAVAAYYYLRILVVMYMEEPGPATVSVQPLSAGIRTTLWATALGTLILGIFPSVLLNFAQSSSALVK